MIPPPPSEDLTPSVVSALRHGDPALAEILDRAFRTPLFRFCRGYLGDAHLAEDAVQEIFAKAVSASPVPGDLKVWIYSVARNHCLNLLRGRGRRKDRGEMPTGDDLAASLTGPLTGLARAERQAKLKEALATLSEDQREVLRLRYTEQLSRSEISRVLSIPESTVKSRLFEGVKRLREHPALSEG